MVSFDMLVEEMRVTDFGVWPGAKNFVNSVSSMYQFVSSYLVETDEESPLHTEKEILPVRLGFQLEPVHINVDLITQYNEGPNPRHRFQNYKRIDWDQEPPILEECLLRLKRQILIV